MSSTVVSGTSAQHVTLVRDLKLTNNYKDVTTLRKCIKPLYRQHRLQALGYIVQSIWECVWTQQKRDRPDLAATLHSYNLQEPLHPRDTFFGGRTNVVRLYVEGEWLHYYDFTSLYPWSSHLHLPTTQSLWHNTLLWHRQVYRATDFGPLSSRATLPLRKQIGLPSVSYLCGGKHWPTPSRQDVDLWSYIRTAAHWHLVYTRIQKALDKEYTLQKIHKVWHFQHTCDDLFKEYVNTWLKIKEEASGFPSNCTTDEHRQHVADYEAHEGIHPDMTSIRHNPGKRTVTKLCSTLCGESLVNVWARPTWRSLLILAICTPFLPVDGMLHGFICISHFYLGCYYHIICFFKN